MDIDIQPRGCMAMDPDMALSGSASQISPWPQVTLQASHIMLGLPTLTSPDPTVFTVLRLLCFSFSTISPPHTSTSWWFQEGHALGGISECHLPAHLVCLWENLWMPSSIFPTQSFLRNEISGQNKIQPGKTVIQHGLIQSHGFTANTTN